MGLGFLVLAIAVGLGMLFVLRQRTVRQRTASISATAARPGAGYPPAGGYNPVKTAPAAEAVSAAAHLTGLSGPVAEQQFPLQGARKTIGRKIEVVFSLKG